MKNICLENWPFLVEVKIVKVSFMKLPDLGNKACVMKKINTMKDFTFENPVSMGLIFPLGMELSYSKADVLSQSA